MGPLYTTRMTDEYTTSIRQLTGKPQALAQENVLASLRPNLIWTLLTENHALRTEQLVTNG
jgi:hypothetical protein